MASALSEKKPPLVDQLKIFIISVYCLCIKFNNEFRIILVPMSFELGSKSTYYEFWFQATNFEGIKTNLQRPD